MIDFEPSPKRPTTRVAATSVSAATVRKRRVSLRVGRLMYRPLRVPVVRLKTIVSLKNDGADSVAELDSDSSLRSAVAPTS